MPDEADEFLRKWGGAPAAPVAPPVDEADAFLAKWGGADPATPSFADFLKGPGSPQPVAPEPIYDPDYKRPEVTIALRPTTFRPEGEGLPKGQSGSPFGLNDLKTAGAAVGGTIVKGIDTALGAGQNLLERGFEMLPIGGRGARVADLSREGLTWEERTRGPFSRRPGGVPRPIYETTDAILAALPKSVVGDTPPTLDQAEAVLREDPAVRAGLEFSDTTGPFAGNLYGMLRGGKAIGSAVGTTEAGLALATTRVGRGALGATSFGLANWAMDPTHPVQAVTNGALAYAGMKAGEFAASPFLGRLLATAGESAKANPIFVKALAGVAEGTGQSLAPQQHDGEWRSALLAGDWKDVAVNVALNAIFQAGAPDIPQGVKEAYIKGRAGEVPPEYMARLNTLAGPIYDTGRRLAGEARKAEAGAKPWTAADEMAAREEIRQGGATGKAAEAQLAKAKRDTYDADLVTADVLAGGKTGTVNEAVDTVLGQDRTDFARESARKAELVAGPRETQALEMGEAAAEGQATREAAKAAVEPGDPAMLSRPIGGPDNWDLPVAPPAAPGAPAESAPSLALIGKTKDGRAVYGKGDSFYVRGTGGRLGAAHPRDVAEAQAAPEARPADPRKMADDLGAATGGKVEDLLSGSAVLTRGEQDAVRGAWSLLSRAIGEQGTARDVYERSPEGSTRADMADALRTVEHVYDLRVRRGEMPESEADTSLPGAGRPALPEAPAAPVVRRESAYDAIAREELGLVPDGAPGVSVETHGRDTERIVVRGRDGKAKAMILGEKGEGQDILSVDLSSTLKALARAEQLGWKVGGHAITDSESGARLRSIIAGREAPAAPVNEAAVARATRPDTTAAHLEGRASIEPAGRVAVNDPVPEGHVRLYRGEPETLPNVPEASGVLPHRGDRGTWFSPNISYAEQFGKRIKYVDIPRAEYEQHVRGEAEEARLYPGMIRDPANVRLDYEVADSARDYQWAPAAPREEGTVLAGTKPKPRLKSADTLEAEATDKAGLAQLVRREGGIDLTGTNLTGEVNGMRLKESGTTGLVAPNGGGRSKSIQRLMDAAREEGFDIEGWTETQFVERVLADAQGDRTLNPATVDTEKLGAAALRRQDEAINSRLAELPPEERARIEAETQERIRQDRADLEMERAEREAIQAEASGEMGDADTSFDIGANVTGTTREGETVAGQVVRETDRSTIVDTPDGQRSIPKGKATKEPPGIYLGSGLGGIQPMLESMGPAREEAAKGIARAYHGFADWLRMRTVPNMTRSSPEAGSYAGGIINGTTTSSLVAPVWIERVFGENPTAETLAKFGHAAGEWQFRSRKQQLEADLAAATDDVARARIEDKLDRVGTVVGAEGSPFQTKAEMDAYLDSPEFKAMAEKWREQWHRANIVDGDLLPGPERMYQDLTKRGEADPDLFTSDPRDFLRVNMKPMEPTEEGGTRPVYRTATGSLRAPMLRGHAFSREFTGAAEKYDFDPAALVQNTYQRVHRDWLKPKMYAAMERAGDAERTNLKDPEWRPPTKIKGEDVEVFPITPSRTYLRDGKSFTVPGENLYVRKSLAPEVKQTLRVNSADRQPFVMKALNTAALTGIADNVWNLMLDSMIPASAPGHIPGKAGLQAGIANNLVGMFKQLKYTLRRPEGYNETRLRLAADASWRGARGQEWTPEYVKGRLAEMANPLKIPGVAAEAVVGGLGRVAQRVHEAGRIVLDEAYTNLVKAGLVKETPTSRREFINRVGQYAGRAMGPKTEMLRDTGVQPFIVAKKKSAGEIARKLAFSPGTQAANTSAAVQMRVGQAMRLFTFLGVIGAVNYWKTGSPTGRPGTPLGNIDLGGDDPKTGAPQSLAILGDLTGWGPALRASGATGAFGAKQQGLADAQAIGEASKGPLNAFVYKWLSSPVLDFASRVATGKTIPQNMGGGGGPSAEPAQPGENAIANRLGFAARQAAQLGPVVTQGIDKVLGTGLTPDYAPDPTNEFLDLLKTFAPKRGIRPEIMAAMPDIKNRASAAEWTEWAARQRSNMNPDEWWAWVQKTVGQSNWPSRERSSTLETLSRKRGK